jgi:hypothetical protein
MSKQQRFNMHGHMIEYNKNNRTWTWSKWDYRVQNGEKKVIRRSGSLQFQRMFPSVFMGETENIKARNSEEIEKALSKRGVDFIFLYQGETTVEQNFKTVEEAQDFHNLHTCPHWDLTDYWYAFNEQINSWAMYDSYTGALQFTPQSYIERRTRTAVQTPHISHNTQAVTFH